MSLPNLKYAAEPRTASRRMVGLTDQGKVRKLNADVVHIDETLSFLAVADGVGETMGGKMGAARACELVSQYLYQNEVLIRSIGRRGGATRADVQGTIRVAFQQAHLGLKSLARHQPDMGQVATTLVCALLIDDAALIAHVGDSTAYLVNEEGAWSLTRDHRGRHTAVGAVSDPNHVPLVRALGVGSSAKPDVQWIELEPNDRLILCSDGLGDYLKSPHELHDVCMRFPTSHVPHVLVDLANVRGGADNIAVAALGTATESSTADSQQSPVASWSQLEIFQGLSVLELHTLMTKLEAHEFQDGDPISATDGIWLVEKGQVELQGVGTIYVRPGGLVGESDLSSEGAWGYSATAFGQTRLLRLSRTLILDLLRREPAAGARILWVVLQSLSDKVSLLLGEPVQ